MFSFFGSKRNGRQASLTFIGADMHNHLIPGVDDGSPDANISAIMAEGLIFLGYKGLYCTPHVISDVHPNTPETIRNGYRILRSKLHQNAISVNIGYAAEYMAHPELEELIEEKKLLPIAGKYVLIEMSYAVESPNIRDVIFKIQTSGLKPILAHPERYPYYHFRFDQYEDLYYAGAEFQINLLSLGGYYGKPVRKIAEKLIDQRWVSWVGTDMHHLQHLEALRKLSFDKHALRMIKKIDDLKNSTLLESFDNV